MEAGAVIQPKGGKGPTSGQETKGRGTAPGIRWMLTRGRRAWWPRECERGNPEAGGPVNYLGNQRDSREEGGFVHVRE